MQVYRAFLKILKKNLPAVSIYFFIFMGLTIAFSRSGNENSKTQFEQEKLTLCIINQDDGGLGKDLKDYLSTLHKLKNIKNDKETLQDALYNRQVDYILYIPNDFTEKMNQGITSEVLRTIKIPGGTAGFFIDTQVEQYLSTLKLYLKADYAKEQAVKQAKKDLSVQTKVTVPNGEEVSELEPAFYYFNYLPYIFICITIMGLGPILMAFQKKEISDRNNCSSMSLKNKNMQITIGCITFVTFCLIIFMFLAGIMYSDFVFSINGLLSFINAGIFILIALAMTFLFAQFAKNENILNMGCNTIGLGLSFLGGIFVPHEIMGDKVLQVARFTPTYWYVIANEKIQGIKSFAHLPKEVLISFGLEAAFAISIFSIGLIITKRKQDAK
ncbi:ABC transporter permease [Anaerosacchariphilus polymeriproducens]|uniref:ABC transporter permease n=1 Tax=Anaerosacchariphilus polymeriproducens TaxID=1812858 RepID=A0A371ATG3_9FIRM|nr:ABC transporter permease [Anaerosacchariphilus polymeriproducens]RDU22829.1 ABC transporter permease [Anaerosacchariphilus polymeriproducens]